jgi:transcriptional regulator with XRE-family HTH domain
VSRRLRRIRRGLGLSAPEVAKALDLTRVEILHREAFVSREPRFFELQQLALHYGWRLKITFTPIGPKGSTAPLASGRPNSPRTEPIPPPSLVKKLIALSTVDELMDEFELSEKELMDAFAACGVEVPKRRLRLRSSWAGAGARA